MEQIKLAAGYIRVSTAEQSTKGLSIETQIAEIKAYAKHNRMKLIDIYIDRGITARKALERRVDFMRMMEDVKNKKINHIIVLRLDRFFRNVYDYHKMMNEYLIPNKCDWSAVKEEYTTETTNGRLMINLRLSIAEQECDTDSDRIKDVLNNRVAQGFVNNGCPPFGLKIVDKRLVRDPETTHIVKDAFELMAELNSVRKVMNRLNEKYEGQFLYSRISDLLRKPIYYGAYREYENYCEPTISKELFDKVQYLLKMNVRSRKNNYTYIFSGLLRCDECDHKLSGNATPTKTYYRCNHSQQSRRCPNRFTTPEIVVEEYLLENAERLIREYLEKSKVTAEVTEDTAPAYSNKKQIEEKLMRLNELYVNGFIDMTKYKADYESLQAQIIDVPEIKSRDLTPLKEFLESNVLKIYHTLSKEEKQRLWRGVIEEIRVSGKEVKDIKFLKASVY